MRTLPVQLASEIAKEAFSIGHLVKIDFNTPAYLTDKDMDVVYDNGDGTGAHTYLARGISFNEAQYSLLPKVDSISFSVDNVSLEFSSYVMNQDTRGKQCTIYRAAFDESLQVIGSVVLFPGYLDRVEIDQQRCTFEISNQFIKWSMPSPRRLHGVTCPWTFKDPATCKYSGGLTTCDKSWTQCIARTNTPNNGSFRWLPELADKKVFFGRT